MLELAGGKIVPLVNYQVWKVFIAQQIIFFFQGIGSWLGSKPVPLDLI